MEFIRRNLHQLYVKNEAATQVTFDEDYNVPDAKPDVGRMIQKKGEIEVSDVQVTDGRARVFGNLNFCLLYAADGEPRRICSMSGELPIDEQINLDGLAGGDKVRLAWELEDLTIHLVNSRKLNIRAVVSLRASVEEGGDVQVPVELQDGDGISVKKQEMRVLELGAVRRDTMRIKKEVPLAPSKPNIREILWKDVEVRGLDLRAEENRVTAKGELFVFFLYAGDDEDNALQWLEQAIPFVGEAECPGSALDMIPDIEAVMSQGNVEVQPDADGEERVFQIDAVLDLDIRLYRESDISVIQDVYSPKIDCVPVRKSRRLEQLLVRNCSKCRAGDRIRVNASPNKILQICHSDGHVKLDEVKVVPNGIQAQGIVELRILYIVSDDAMPFYAAEAVIPFTHVIEAPGIGGDCRFDLHTGLEQLSTAMIDSDEIEVKALINLDAVVLAGKECEIMEEAREQEPDREKLQNMPGIVCYFVQPGDTLWDIAKRFNTTEERIREVNDLKKAEPKPRQPLLLIKSVE